MSAHPEVGRDLVQKDPWCIPCLSTWPLQSAKRASQYLARTIKPDMTTAPEWRWAANQGKQVRLQKKHELLNLSCPLLSFVLKTLLPQLFLSTRKWAPAWRKPLNAEHPNHSGTFYPWAFYSWQIQVSPTERGTWCGLGSCHCFIQKIGATLGLSLTNTRKKSYLCFPSHFPPKNSMSLTGFFSLSLSFFLDVGVLVRNLEETIGCLSWFFQTGRTAEEQAAYKHLPDLISSGLSAEVAHTMPHSREKTWDICRAPSSTLPKQNRKKPNLGAQLELHKTFSYSSEKLLCAKSFSDGWNQGHSKMIHECVTWPQLTIRWRCLDRLGWQAERWAPDENKLKSKTRESSKDC